MSLFMISDDDDDSDIRNVWSKGTSLFNISSPLNELLERETFTLNEVLSEDELIQEVKSRNHLLLEYLSQEEVIEQLIKYVVVPQPDVDDIERLKFPFMACEVICCDILIITEALVSANGGALLDLLFSFLEQPAPLDSRHAGYFEKIVSLLMIRKPNEIARCINKQSLYILEGFIEHCHTFAIAELFKRLLQPLGTDFMDDGMDMNGFGMSMGMGMGLLGMDSMGLYTGDDMEPGTPTGSEVENLLWLQDERVVIMLVKNLLPTDPVGEPIDSDVHKHVSEILVDIIHYGEREHDQDNTESSLITFLEQESTINLIIDAAIPSGGETFCSSSMTSSLSVLGALLSRHTSTQYTPLAEEEELPKVVSLTLERLPQIIEALKGNDHNPGFIRTQTHKQVPRLGMRRLKLVGLLVLLMQSKYHAVDEAIAKNSIIPILLDLFFEFELVNMLHADVESMIATIIECGSSSLQVGLIRDANILERILRAYDDNEAAKSAEKGCSKGYIGYLNRISNVLVSNMEEAKEMIEAPSASLDDMTSADSLLELFSEKKEVWEEWSEFSKTKLVDINKNEGCPLGGVPAPYVESEQDPYEVFGKQDNFNFPDLGDAENGGLEDDDDIQRSGLGAGYRGSSSGALPDAFDDDSSSDEDEFTEFNPRTEESNSSPFTAHFDEDFNSTNVETMDRSDVHNVPPPVPAPSSPDAKARNGNNGDSDGDNWAHFEELDLSNLPVAVDGDERSEKSMKNEGKDEESNESTAANSASSQ